MQFLSQREYGLTGLINPVRVVSKKDRHVAKKVKYNTKVTNQGYAYVYISIILWNIILAIFLIFYLKITRMTTNTARSFSNSRFNNNCYPQKAHTIPWPASPFMLQPPLLPAQAAERSPLGTWPSLPSSPQHLSLVTQCCSSPSYLSSPLFPAHP